MIRGSSGSSPGPRSRRLQLDAAPSRLSPWVAVAVGLAAPAALRCGARRRRRTRPRGCCLPLSGEVSGGGGRGSGAVASAGQGGPLASPSWDADPASSRCGPRPFSELSPASFGNRRKTCEQNGRRCQEEINCGFYFCEICPTIKFSVSFFKFMCISRHSLCVYVTFVFCS